MTKVKVHIDTKNYTSKPTDFDTIKPRLQCDKTLQEIEIPNLIEKIKHGYTISPAVMKGGMSAKNWNEQSLFLVDIDNNNKDIPLLNVKDALAICKGNNLNPVFYYYTFSHCKSKPKYRLVFLMDKPITDTKLREIIISTLVNIFPQSDTSCKNADRIFLSTNKQVILCDENARINIDDVLKLSKVEIVKHNNSFTNKLDELKNNFNLLEYMCKENEISKRTDDIIYFKDCSICGHNNCLRYYPKSNSFYCFGANGAIGGSIIDYLMANEQLSLEQAINKLKTLCNINDSINDIKYISAKELQNKKIPPIEYYINNLLPQGLNLICSVPKLGKSWFALQLCLSIAQGKKFLRFDTKQSSCLYLALEDSENRLQNRCNKLLNGLEAPSNLHFNIYNKNLDTGLIEELTKVISNNPNIKVIVIDTLQKIRGTVKSSNVYANDYKELSQIKSFADKNNLCILLIHHLRKNLNDNDVFERVSGTNGIMGTADTTIILSKKNRDDAETILSVVGRDVELNDYVIKFNKNTCKWEMLNTVDNFTKSIEKQNYYNNTLVKTIKHLVSKNDGLWQGTLKELNNIHISLFHKEYSSNGTKLKNEVEKLKHLLLKYDNIEYIPSGKSPTINGRIQTFKKKT